MNRLIKNVMQIFLILLLFCANMKLFAEDNVITVYCHKGIGQVNEKVYGNNFIAYDPMTYEDWADEYYGYSDYGAGIWDPKWDEPVKEVVNLAKEAGVTIVRFPGGCGTHHYNWKNAIGKKREHFLYGIDEFLKTCSEIGAEAVITVSYFTGNERDAADLVEYLNSPNDGNNPNGGIDWVAERTKNRHPKAYSVTYFEIGNEIYHGDHRNIKEVFPEEYAQRYLKYYEAMKAVDPSIKIGVVLHTSVWNRKVLKIVKDKLDFGIVHTYPNPVITRELLERMGAKDIFRITLAKPILKNEIDFKEILKVLKEKSGKDIPLAVTEYNCGLVQDKPVPYRHCLGTALLNAELLRIFMKPEHKILMANYWNFVNEYWGIIKSRTDFVTHDYRKPIQYIKRPNYYMCELYNKHFGDELIAVEVKSDFYIMNNAPIPYLSVNASKSEDGNKIYLMVINKNLDENITSSIELNDFIPDKKGNAWVLNGLSVDATNEKNPNNVKVKHKKFEIQSNPFQFAFEPHSLTAIEIDGN